MDSGYLVNAQDCESKAIQAIARYMCNGLDCRVEYKDERKRGQAARNYKAPSVRMLRFWKYSIAEFEKAIEKLSLDSYVEAAFLEYVDISREMDDSVSMQKQDGEREESLLHDEETDSERGSVEWDDEFTYFEDAYNDLKAQFLDNQAKRKNCDRLFTQLKEELLDAKNSHSPDRHPKKPFLGRVQLSENYMSKMFDLRDDSVCRLLPYLLTAYIGTYRRNRFLVRDSAFCDKVFGTGTVLSFEASKIRETIKKFAHQTFSLREWSHPDGTMQEAISGSNERPSVFFRDITEKAYTENATFMEGILGIWSEIIPACARRTELKRLERDYDIEMCQTLFSTYSRNRQTGGWADKKQ